MPDMKSVEERLSTWRRFAGDAMPPEPVSRGIDRVASLHRAQLERTGRLALENLKAHDQFCAAIEAYVKERAGERSEEHQQRVADYAAYLLRVYENASSQALGPALGHIRDGLPREVVEVIREIPVVPPPQKSWLSRFLIG
jgi:hypothetical protein